MQDTGCHDRLPASYDLALKPKKIFLDHDGGIDDFIAQILLLNCKNVELVGISVIDADCYIDSAFEVSRKLTVMLDRYGIPFAKSTLTGKHPFPSKWRRFSESCNYFPSLLCTKTSDKFLFKQDEKLTGQELLVKCIRESPEPVTIVVTGPVTNIAWALDNDPGFHANVKEVLIMGGAVDVAGNVLDQDNHDGSAEWNIYYDAPALDRLLRSPLRLVLVSLDATNAVPITKELLQRFGAQNRYLASQFAGAAYAMCIPGGYFAWDVLTAAIAVRPDLCRLEEVPITVELNPPQAVDPSHLFTFLSIIIS